MRGSGQWLAFIFWGLSTPGWDKLEKGKMIYRFANGSGLNKEVKVGCQRREHDVL